MLDTLFVGLTVLYIAVAAKIDEWITIAALGFKLETPQGFLEYPRAYDLIRAVIFLSAASTLYSAKLIPWYLGLVVLCGAWLFAGSLGQKRAFMTYRHVWRGGIEDAETPDDRAWREAESERTDKELRERILAAGKR